MFVVRFNQFLKVYGYTIMYYYHLIWGDFCGIVYASLPEGALPKRDLLLKEELCSEGSKYLPLIVRLVEKGV